MTVSPLSPLVEDGQSEKHHHYQDCLIVTLSLYTKQQETPGEETQEIIRNKK